MISEEELKVIYEKTKGIMHITQHKRFWDYFNLLKEESNLVEKQRKETEDLKVCVRVYTNKKDNKKFISTEHGDYLIF